jgi:glycerol-3-phosphate dehydrogenase (NAD(P)+)
MSAQAEHAKPLQVAVIGGGPWGVALALAASRAGADVTLCTRRQHPEGRRGVRVTSSLADAAKSRLVVLAVPSQVARSVLGSAGDHLDGSHLVVHGIRGLDGDDLETVSDIAREETPVRRLGALGGPVQASDLIDGRPSAMVVGSRYPEVLAAATTAFQSDSLRVYGTPDHEGLEWASALVGCLAIGIGFAQKAGAGPGLLAALISRAVDEAARIVTAAGADEHTMYGLGGYGDLLASIAITDRPEVVLGRALAEGKSVAASLSEARLRVEAVALVPRIVAFARDRKVAAPTFDALSRILSGGRPEDVLGKLFAA